MLVFSEETSKRRFLRSRVFKDGDRSLYRSSMDRIFSFRFTTLKLVMTIIIIGAIFTFLRSPSIHETDHMSRSRSRYPTLIFQHSYHLEQRLTWNICISYRFYNHFFFHLTKLNDILLCLACDA